MSLFPPCLSLLHLSVVLVAGDSVTRHPRPAGKPVLPFSLSDLSHLIVKSISKEPGEISPSSLLSLLGHPWPCVLTHQLPY